MDELFVMTMVILLAGGLLVAPIVTLILCVGIRRRQQELARELSALKAVVRTTSSAPSRTIVEPKESDIAEVPPPVSFKQTGFAAAPAPIKDTRPPPVSATTAQERQKTEVPPSVILDWPPAGARRLPPAPPTIEPNRFEAAARQILSRVWNWIIVGEEFRKPGISVEYAVATNWLVRAGVLIVVVGVGFFLDYSSTRGWLGAPAKVALALLTGSALLTTGIRLLDRRYHLLAQGLLGAGLAIWYAAIFAAFNRYHLIDAGTAFAIMAAVTFGAGFMAVRFNSMLVAILGIIGGYGTPVILSTGEVNFIGLYSYMLLLGTGVLVIARRRSWHLLNTLAFAATYLLIIASLDSGFTPDRFWQVMPFLVAFFILFSTVTFLYQVINAQKATLIELIMLILNASLFFGISYGVIQKTTSTDWSAAVALGLAAFYTAHLYLFLKKKTRDRGLALGFIALAAFFLIVTLPLLISSKWLTLCWSVQALVLLWLSAKLGSRFLQYVAYGLYLIVFGRFFWIDMYNAFGSSIPPETDLFSYLKMLTERLITFGIPILSTGLAMRLTTAPSTPDKALALEPSSDIKPMLRKQHTMVAVGVAVFAMLFLYLHLEINRTLFFVYNPLRLPALTALWVSASLMLLLLFTTFGYNTLITLLLLFVTGTLVKLFSFDLPVWGIAAAQFRYLPQTGYSFLDAGMRLVDYGIILSFFVYAFLLLRRSKDALFVRNLFGYGSIFLLLIYSTLEINSFFAHFVPGLRAGAISVFWGIFALGITTGGLVQRIRPLRLAGLALFSLVAVKVFLSDLALLDPLYKIVAFTLLGAILLAGAFAYLRFQDTFSAPKDNPESPLS